MQKAAPRGAVSLGTSQRIYVLSDLQSRVWGRGWEQSPSRALVSPSFSSPSSLSSAPPPHPHTHTQHQAELTSLVFGSNQWLMS